MKNLTRLLAVFVLVVFGVVSFAQNPDMSESNRKYLTFGRNPMIPGGVSFEQARQRGWQPFNVPQDVYTTMYGANGERVAGWIKAGTAVAWDKGERLRILACGNLTDLLRVLVDNPAKERVEYVDRPGKTIYVDVPGEVQYRTEYKEKLYFVRIYGMDNQKVAQLGAPTVVHGGGTSFAYNRGVRINNSNFQTQEQIAEAAAAAAAAAAASSSSTSTTPTSGAGTSGGSSSGSSGASDGGSKSGSG